MSLPPVLSLPDGDTRERCKEGRISFTKETAITQDAQHLFKCSSGILFFIFIAWYMTVTGTGNEGRERGDDMQRRFPAESIIQCVEPDAT